MLRFLLCFSLAISAVYPQANDACTVRTVAAGGVAQVGYGEPALEAMLLAPGFVRQGPDGLLYFADANHSRIFRIHEEGNLETLGAVRLRIRIGPETIFPPNEVRIIVGR